MAFDVERVIMDARNLTVPRAAHPAHHLDRARKGRGRAGQNATLQPGYVEALDSHAHVAQHLGLAACNALENARANLGVRLTVEVLGRNPRGLKLFGQLERVGHGHREHDR